MANSDGPEAALAETGRPAPHSERSAEVSGAVRPAQLQLAERIAVGALSALQGALLLWAAVMLPWKEWSLFALVSGAAGVSHIGTALACVGSERLAPRFWLASSVLGVLLWLLVSWQVFTGGGYLVGLYGPLGEGLFAALLAIWGLFVLVTLPTAAWAFVRARALFGTPRLKRFAKLSAAGGCIVLGSGFWLAYNETRVKRLTAPLELEAFDSVARTLRSLPKRKTSEVKSRPSRDAVQCAKRLDQGTTLIVSHQRGSKLRSYCLQGDDPKALLKKVAKRVRKWKRRSNIKIDVITGMAPLSVGPKLLSALRMRPGLDGVCLDDHCLAPWQLISRGAFTKSQPLSFLKDLKFGISERSLRRMLGGSQSELTRITTQSVVIDQRGKTTPLRRLRPYQRKVTQKGVARAKAAAQTHILEAQLKDGKFRYTLHPFSGRRQTRNFNLARQAGTLYALCELSQPSPKTDAAIKLGLELMRSHDRPSKRPDLSGLAMKKKAKSLELSKSALPLVAFLSCRDRVGAEFDPLIRRLTRLVLELQRADGGFHPKYSLKHERKSSGKEPLYAPGQAVLALVLLEELAAKSPETNLAEAVEVRAAAELAMNYVAEEHWDHALYPFLFIEENWHCLAARAALEVHPNRGYENFCLDYVKFRSRLILDEQSNVSPEFVGGLGFGNVIPPHNTGAAGFGEALSAAIAVKRFRGQSIERDQALLKQIFGFLLRQQWTDKNCFGCVPEALGAISEHTHSPITRIDFVQHAWAALGYESVDYDG